MNEFTLTTPAEMPAEARGRRKTDLRRRLETMKPGECLEWRGVTATLSKAAWTVNSIYRVGLAAPRSFTCRKEDGGVNIYRLK